MTQAKKWERVCVLPETKKKIKIFAAIMGMQINEALDYAMELVSNNVEPVEVIDRTIEYFENEEQPDITDRKVE